MNQNGLLSSKDVSATGDENSNFFLRKGTPIAVPSPLQIISPDTTKVTTISVSNSGSTVIDSELDLRFANNDGNVFFTAPDGTIFAVAVNNGGDTNFQTSGDAQLNITSDGITTIAPVTQSSGNGALRIQNGTACPFAVNFVTYVGGQDSGGLTIGNLQTYGYRENTINKVFDIDVFGETCIIGSSQSVGGTVLEVDGTLGLSRVLDGKYNPPSYVLQQSLNVAGPISPLLSNKTVATINLAGNTKFVLYFSDFSYSTNSVTSPTMIYKWFISDSIDGQQENAVSPLKFIKESDTGFPSAITNNGTQIFIYNSSTPMTTLYLNVVQENQAQGGQIVDFTALVTIVASR